MRYEEFRDAVAGELRANRDGLTWAQLKRRLRLPYRTPCYEWLARMEKDVGLTREPGEGRAYVWTVRGGGGTSR